ncbi:hypothetical protein KOW79_020317 [Hemibagrus wyckioides]|uniref:Uncharacterized protein n=1 Tax=Hemibagrus wyckioides TaxID=337641 RepID=A0A9D3S9V9_9TELE|nr:hypothetical protein KOW79_020317 [Hemibagrus wyckioides]
MAVLKSCKLHELRNTLHLTVSASAPGTIGAIGGARVPGVHSNTSVYSLREPATGGGGGGGCDVYHDSTSFKPTHMRTSTRNLSEGLATHAADGREHVPVPETPEGGQ